MLNHHSDMITHQQSILKRISAKKAQLDSLHPLPTELDKNLYEWFRVAVTYSSNAIEGNTLSLSDTAQVVEKQITVGGKSIDEHLKALNHARAIDFIQNIATTKKREQLETSDILSINKIILHKNNVLKVPDLMDELMTYITSSPDHITTIAAQAHLQLIGIHPFVDGNGRTARLLMNLLLLQQEYPLVIVDAKDRKTYISAIQKALQVNTADYYDFIYAAIEHSLDEYIKAAHESE